MSQRPIRSLRLNTFSGADLQTFSGGTGEIFYDNTNKTLRVMDSTLKGGYSLARADLNNVSNSAFLAKSVAAGVGGSGGVQSGEAGRLAYYPSTGTQVNDLAEVYWHTHDGANMLHINGLLEVSGQKNKIRFHWDTLADLQSEVSASTWHGMVAHVHETGKLYYAHSAQWVPVAAESSLPNTFSTISVTGQSSVVADSTTDTLTLAAGSGIQITTSASTDTITISSTSSVANFAFTTSQITTNDNSAITIVPQTQFSGNVLVDGNISLQGAGNKQISASLGGSLRFNQDITVFPATNSDFVIDTYNGAAHKIWRFDSGGDLIFPDDTIQTTAYTGNVGSINTLSDVDTTTTPPTVGQVLKWNGNNWVPGTDATTGGTGTDADTLDGFDSSYFLNFNNLSNKPNIFNTIAVSGQSSVVADSGTDTLTLVAGTGITITTVAGTDTITIAATGGGGSGTVTTVSVASANGFAGTVSNASTTPAITLSTSITGLLKGDGTAISAASAGTDYQAPISLTTTGTSGPATLIGTTLNIPSYASGVSVFSSLTDANTASLTVDKFYLPAITSLSVGNVLSTAYTFDQYSGNNPTIYCISGTTIAFNLNVTGHPFLIQTAGGSNYNTGLVHVDNSGTVSSGSNAQGKTSGTLYWKIPVGTTGNYKYICSIHSAMTGVITIKDISAI